MSASALALGTLIGAFGQQPAEAPPAPVLRIEPVAGSGVLAISRADLPDGRFEFVSLEALVDGRGQTPLYPMKLEPGDWREEDGAWRYSWTFPHEVRLEFVARAKDDRVEIEYTLTNEAKTPLPDVRVYPCLPTMGMPAFHPGTAAESRADAGGRAARVGKKDWSELYERLHLWSKGKPFAFAESPLAPDEKHLAFMLDGETPFDWSWWKNDERRFDAPLVALASKEGRHTLALALERSVQASSNVGDGRACFHLVPGLGTLAPGAAVTFRGRIYLIEGKPQDAWKRFRDEAPFRTKPRSKRGV